jgi:hypothetical protein
MGEVALVFGSPLGVRVLDESQQNPSDVVEYSVVDDQCVSVMTTTPPRFQLTTVQDVPVT